MTGAIKDFLDRLDYWTKSLLSFVSVVILLIALIIAVLVVISMLPQDILGLGTALVGLLKDRITIPEISTGHAFIPALALAFIAYVKIKQNSEYRRAAFLAEYVSKIFTDKELSDTFHNLIYTYRNKKFDEIRDELKRNQITSKSGQEAMYQCLEPLQERRKKGWRLYHPGVFQGSVEEKRLDSLLGYFNIIAYYYVEEKLLSIKDIDGSVGYHLTVMSARTVIKKYMNLIENEWETEGYAKNYGTKPPFHYLKKMLDELDQRRNPHRSGRWACILRLKRRK